MPKFRVFLSWVEYHGEAVDIEADSREQAARKMEEQIRSGEYALGETAGHDTYSDTGDFDISDVVPV